MQSFNSLIAKFAYNKLGKVFKGTSALDEIIDDITVEDKYSTVSTPKNLGIFDSHVLKKEDVLDFKTFMFELYPTLFFIIKQLNEYQVGIKAVKREDRKMERCFIETVYILDDTKSQTSEVSDTSASSTDSAWSVTTSHASKERLWEYQRSEKLVLKDKEAKEKAKEIEKKAKEEATKEKEKADQFKKPCAFFFTKKGCYNGDECKFRHSA
jgi:hypothetical protein